MILELLFLPLYLSLAFIVFTRRCEIRCTPLARKLGVVIIFHANNCERLDDLPVNSHDSFDCHFQCLKPLISSIKSTTIFSELIYNMNLLWNNSWLFANRLNTTHEWFYMLINLELK
jgi:hypothetical protein